MIKKSYNPNFNHEYRDEIKREHTKRTYDTKRPPEKEMIFGVRAVMEAIDAGKVLDKVLVRRDMSSAIGKELLIKLEGTGTQIQRVPLEKLNQFTDKNHQGVIAFLSPIEFTPLDSLVQSLYDEGKTPLLMMLDGVTDVRNFGAIARTCVCAGVQVRAEVRLSTAMPSKPPRVRCIVCRFARWRTFRTHCNICKKVVFASSQPPNIPIVTIPKSI